MNAWLLTAKTVRIPGSSEEEEEKKKQLWVEN